MIFHLLTAHRLELNDGLCNGEQLEMVPYLSKASAPLHELQVSHTLRHSLVYEVDCTYLSSSPHEAYK